MNISSYRRLTMALSVACAGLLIVYGFLFWNYFSLKMRVAFASEQTKIFDEMRTRALASEPADAASHLEYVVDYYPSGTKQEKGSLLDQMVERDRNVAIRAVVAHLRRKTGENLGENPEAWIQKFATR